MKITLVGLNARYTHSCLALFYVRNELLRHGGDLRVEIRQHTINDSYYETLLHLSATEADYYFFSAAIWNSDLVYRLIEDLLRLDSRCFCVVGGPQAEIVGRQAGHPRCCVVRGEIEGVGMAFYRDLEQRRLQARYTAAVAGRAFSAPYVDDDFTDHLQNRHIYYESSRGCPFSCTYCLSAARKGVWHKDLDLVRDELARILKWNPPVLRFVDRTFNDTLDRALAIWQFLMEQPCDTVFHFEMSPDRFSQEMFAFLEKLPAGRFQFEIGIQSTNEATLAAIRRPMDCAAAHANISRLARLRTIHLHADLILGLPYDTEASFMRSFREVFAMGPHYIQMGLLKVLPDTPMCHTAPEFGYSYSSAPPYSVLANRWLDHRELRRLYWFCECVERFINNRYFGSLWDYFRRSEIDIVRFFEELLQVCRTRSFFQRAPTQEFLCTLILESVVSHDDNEYVVELLRYDWLRCSHRFLPPRLEVREERSSKAIKKELFRHVNEDFICDCSAAEKMHYLKKGYFLEFSKRFIEEQGYAPRPARHVLCFAPERERGLHNLGRVVQFYLPERSSASCGPCRSAIEKNKGERCE